jgi:hypothetical protein
MKKLTTALLGLVSTAVISTAAQADPMTTPAMSGPLTANPDPFSVDLPVLGKTYITGSVSGIAFAQSNPQHFFPKDDDAAVDLANAQVFIQKTDGTFQYFIQAGTYALPSLGAPYIESSITPPLLFGDVPVAYGKLAFDSFSIEAGKLPTLIGDEYTFTFENMNIERGLLWNQEPAISRGVQANYSSGPFNISLSWNDGYYSNRWNWLSGLASYAFNGGSDVLALAGGGNLSGNPTFGGFATPVFQNAGTIWNLIWTHTSGPWVISPYIQYQTVPSTAFTSSATMFGAAVLGTYSIDDNWKITGRVEYEKSSGNALTAPNILYGVGSSAWSLSVTPTYVYKVFFARIEGSYTTTSDATPGLDLGPIGTDKDQFRGVLEVGINL